MVSSNEMTYSLFIKPEVVTTPPINSFEFQTEDDYSDQMEAEMQWIYDRHRLQQQNIVSNHPYVISDDNNTDTQHSIPQYLPKDMIPDPNNNYLMAQNRVPFSPEVMAQNRVPFSPEVMAQNNLLLNSQQMNSQFVGQNEKSIQPKSDFNKSNIWEELATNTSSDSQSIPYKASHILSPNTNNEDIERVEPSTENVGQWERVVDKRGKSIEQRVIAVPQKSYHFPKGLHQIGKTQIITDSEQVMTQTLKPIIEEKELRLPETRF